MENFSFCAVVQRFTKLKSLKKYNLHLCDILQKRRSHRHRDKLTLSHTHTHTHTNMQTHLNIHIEGEKNVHKQQVKKRRKNQKKIFFRKRRIKIYKCFTGVFSSISYFYAFIIWLIYLFIYLFIFERYLYT